MFDKIIAFFMSLIAGFCGIFGIPYYAVGEKVDMDKFELVWSDEFEGDSVDWNTWTGHYAWETNTDRKGSVWNQKMATVKDGKLVIRTEYYEDGLDGGHAGYYNYGMDTSDSYRQTYGYFECRCILPKGVGMWSAFWMISNSMAFNNSPGEVIGGADGAEVDAFESAFYESKTPRRVSSNIHVDGYGEFHRQSNVCKPFLLWNDPYENFNTYGLEWNEKEYIFYVNGVETGRSDFGGVCEVPMYLILSVEVGGNNAVPEKDWTGGPLAPDCTPTDFIIDYVRAYQYK